MCAQLTQDNRSIAIATPLGKDKLLLTRVEYRERLNRPFEIVADMISTDQTIKFDDIVGKPVVVSIKMADNSKRFFHGLVAKFEQCDRTVGAAVYHATVVPWLAHLNNTSDCQIFQNKGIPDIVSEVVKKAGFSGDFELKLTETYEPQEFLVQYRETTFNFISRLLEKAGIGYHFRHEENRHVMVLTDAVSKHTAFKGYDSVPYREADSTGTLIESIQNLQHLVRAKTGKFVQSDYDFKRPKADLRVTAPVARAHALADFERFDYPGEYVETSEGSSYVKARIEEIQTEHEVVRGSGSTRGLVPGCTFRLKDHPRADQNREYLLTSVSLDFDAGGFTAGSAEEGDVFGCIFEAIPTSQQYRPVRRTRKALVSGPQTAIVTGPPGEEIHTDEHGRVKVHFHWDRYGKFDADSSCWIRVSQYWAGKGWGAMHIPRIGQEVIVEFLEGDPDRPIITGRVYNGEARPPYALPGNKNISTVMSRSTKGGGADNFNEVKMDDSKGKELLYIQAEKDRTLLVKNDNTETIKHDETIEIGNNRSKHVKKSEDVTIDENRTEDVKKNEDITIGQNRTEEVKKDETVKIGVNRTHEVGKLDKLKVGKELVIDVGDQITLQTGKSSIIMKKDGTIKITGKDITLNASGKINIIASSDVTIKGSKIKEN